MTKFIDQYEVQDAFDGKWLKIFYHNSANKVFFQQYPSSSEVLFSNQSQKFSLLKYLPFINRYEKEWFEFRIEYPEKAGYIRWKQNLNPLLVYQDTSGKIENFIYKPIYNTWEDQEDVFGGLVRLDDFGPAFLTGSATLASWHYAIGASQSWYGDNTFPAVAKKVDNDDITNTIFVVSQVVLWIRVKEYHHLFIFPCTLRKTTTDIKIAILIFLPALK